MLVLYHNRYSFSIDDSTADYLDDFERYLQRPLNFRYLPPAKRQQINLIRNRVLYLLENNRPIFEQLPTRKDYSAFEAKQETILKIYQWLQTLSHEPAAKSGIDINQWKLDLKSQFGQLLLKSESAAPELSTISIKYNLSLFSVTQVASLFSRIFSVRSCKVAVFNGSIF
ncbi:hypothetical protein [Dyadobacter sp. LHD-138]|uniref:hypothetical protein n=1 Tax=Dyadobacter sp. LHD-138 TaxID=3071413 RepID=UPI0027E00BB9|nr:hypothetical protein [Dyadobacter sp. LHD-138]MDQ6477260.1 hypothetical protein [Dyadobacter sp. LHD-138]